MKPRKPRLVGPAVHVCFGYEDGVTPLLAAPATNPRCEPHTPEPDGYMARSEWAEQMMTTHTQRACKGCGRLLIWELTS